MNDSPVAAGKRNYRWVWFFVAVALLAIVSIGWLTYYNLGQQLQPEQLAAARRLWEEKGPRDYLLIYTVKRGPQHEPDRYVVTVRGGKAVSATANNKVEPADRLHYYGMPALFRFLEDNLDQDSKPGQRRPFTRAIFDGKDGHLLWYVRRLRGGTQRQEINVDSLKPLEKQESRARDRHRVLGDRDRSTEVLGTRVPSTAYRSTDVLDYQVPTVTTATRKTRIEYVSQRALVLDTQYSGTRYSGTDLIFLCRRLYTEETSTNG